MIAVRDWEGLAVPLDGSPESERAIPVAVAIGARMGVPVHLVTVVDEFQEPAVAQQILGHPRPGGPQVAEMHVVVHRSAGAAIADFATSRRLGVCMTSRGLGRVWRSVLGSVAIEVIRAQRGPLVVIGPACVIEDVSVLDRISVCLDGSVEAEQSLGVAVQWVARVGAYSQLFSVVSPATTVFDLLEPVSVDRASERGRYLRDLADGLADTMQVGYALVNEHDPATAIVNHLRTTRSVGALATHARHGAELLVLGSVATPVVRHSPSPVLLAVTPDRP